MSKISIVVPVFNEERVIKACYDRLSAVMKKTELEYELIFADDGSKDASFGILCRLAQEDTRVKVISFSRNFGHQTALTAGVDNAFGDAVVTIDADLQDPPEVIPQLIEKWMQGCDVVYARRTMRKNESFFKKITARMFYKTMSGMSDISIPKDAGDFRLMDKKVCDVLRTMNERNRYIRGLVSWIGFNQGFVDYVRDGRAAGVTKYPLRKMISLAMDGITSFSHKPLRLATYFGFAFSGISFLYLLTVLIQRIWFPDSTIVGWASTTAVNLFFNGIILIILGIIGEYIGRIYDECKNRPQYIIKEQVNFIENNNGKEHN